MIGVRVFMGNWLIVWRGYGLKGLISYWLIELIELIGLFWLIYEWVNGK